MKLYQIATKMNGKMAYDIRKLTSLISNLFDGRYLVSFQRISPQSSIREYRACYFAKIDAIAFETGNTRYDIHENIKEELIEKMVDEVPDAFNHPTPETSTRYLTEEGWSILLSELDAYAFINFNIIL